MTYKATSLAPTVKVTFVKLYTKWFHNMQIEEHDNGELSVSLPFDMLTVLPNGIVLLC